MSAGVTIEQWRDVEVGLDAGAQWRAIARELARLYEMADASEGRVRVDSSDVPTRVAAWQTYQPSRRLGSSTNHRRAPLDAWHELGDLRREVTKRISLVVTYDTETELSTVDRRRFDDSFHRRTVLGR